MRCLGQKPRLAIFFQGVLECVSENEPEVVELQRAKVLLLYDSALGYLVATKKTVKALPAPKTGGDLFKGLGSFEGKSIREVKSVLETNGFRYAGRTEGGYIKFYGQGTKKTRAEIQIRPNGQVVRTQHTPNGSVRYDSGGNVIQDHSIGEVIGGNFIGN